MTADNCMDSGGHVADKDWNPASYDEKNSFVWKLGSEVVELLSPQAGERILDLGCGTGHLTNQIAARGATVVGLDKSSAMIEQARQLYPEIQFVVAEGTGFTFDEPFDAVFSNAAIHWMKDQEGVARSVRNALRPGGRFIAEFGGKGNIEAIRSTLAREVRSAGFTFDSEPFARFYPTIGEYASLLEAQGFRVTFASHFERPTKLDNGEAGLRNWLHTFTDNVIAAIAPERRDEVIAAVERSLRPSLFRDGNWYADYRRIRIRAVRD